ncbi:MAG: hypothetical protein JOY77_12725 [Alphaproteobacteria bacterium]|nr:hypothetical protein [Alphaproteobacteria bacterium]MBV9063774.1 hypothetical protein [Alphaproteobacteria bacterium]
MPAIVVTPLSALQRSVERYKPSHIVTLLSPEHMIETPSGFPTDRHLRLGMHDVAEAWTSESAPSLGHVNALLAFGHGWTGGAPMIVHCWAGISRSMAAAYILLCERLGPGREHRIAQAIRARAPHAFPNPLLVQLADAALERGGRMVAAVESIGRGVIVAEGCCVELPVSLD